MAPAGRASGRAGSTRNGPERSGRRSRPGPIRGCRRSWPEDGRHHAPDVSTRSGRRPFTGRNRRVGYDASPMIDSLRAMPGGIRLFLVYAFLILAGIGISLRSVVDLAISVPVSFEGLVVMALLAYTIFTTTLVLQRKQAARSLALGLASLTVPLVPLLALSQLLVEAVFVAAFGLALFRGLLRPEVGTYPSEP